MLCWQRSEADLGQRLIEPRESQNRGTLDTTSSEKMPPRHSMSPC